MNVVLDASAILAFLHNEPGSAVAEAALRGGMVSAVNWAEVVQKALKNNVDVSAMRESFMEVGLLFEPFTPAQAEYSAHLWNRYRNLGLSLADRACIALATESNRPLLTGDRLWCEIALDVEVRLIR